MRHNRISNTLNNTILKDAFTIMSKARSMSSLFEEQKEITSKYVHATSKGHEAVQIALGMQLLSTDFVFPYYRDDSILLSIGLRPFDLMLQLLAKKSDTRAPRTRTYCICKIKNIKPLKSNCKKTK